LLQQERLPNLGEKKKRGNKNLNWVMLNSSSSSSSGRGGNQGDQICEKNRPNQIFRQK
jgi:hypothetical protein